MTSYKKLRNLVQYKDMTDEEFEEAMDIRSISSSNNTELEQRIKVKIDEFSRDYDIDDLKINDKLTLRALAQALITLDDLNDFYYNLRTVDGITYDNLTMMKNIHSQMNDLLSSISKLQDDLSITRRVRKGDTESSVISYIENLKQKAKEFYKQRMIYIFCGTCNRLLSTVWLLYTEEEDNILKLKCNAKDAAGNYCNTVTTVRLADLVTNGTNNTEIMAENLR